VTAFLSICFMACYLRFRFFFFFFQAEDGIRDLYVTGVQTCALPICVELAYHALVHGEAETRTHDPVAALQRSYEAGVTDEFVKRSEERRVGKECRSRWSPDH